MLNRVTLSYQVSTTCYFERIRPLGNAILLDSGKPDSERGRFDILVAAPVCQLTYHRGALSGINLPISVSANTDPFVALQDLYSHSCPTSPCPPSELPFCGGLVGHFGYDLGRVIEKIPTQALDDTLLPEMQVGLYSWAIIIDHTAQTACLVGSHLINNTALNALAEQIADMPPAATTSPTKQFCLTSEFSSNLTEPQYHSALSRIDDYIHAGDCYQVNLAQRFSAHCQGDPWHAYKQLRSAASTHYAAYFDTEHGAVLSLSPERFLATDRQGHVITQPIKGTRPRGADDASDQKLAEELKHSEKDRSENVMIVDLMRNDLSKVCQHHSVKTPSLFTIESYKNVHHLVSTVTGTLNIDQSPISLLRHCFPGGSITGAPKIRAMEIIDELEPHRRSIYCGSIGYLCLSGQMDTSITIRTLLVENNEIHCWAGGGIVADSISEMEYQETYDKVNNLLSTLESM
ncbi:aminodeoxychorismate synthase component I [Neptunomonas antarctica]|uniref:aminodeoxychorismate synthase n=1 Tax=Neptunomonas antarctica TaxID=619304 RepID=A0A1N7KBS8_9GAMM|nr:aminodeoxychorismate synthase component I [Neptunomonas antarctica]SIS59055.1 aminodeoxychorismate synthase, subunit I [Neptunomonas antarctica]